MQMSDNRDLFWKLMEPEYMQAMMFCRKLMANREKGDDLFQDALVLAFTKFPSLRDTSAFRQWIYRIFVNTFKSTVRRPWWKRFVPLMPEIEMNLIGDDPIETYNARRWLGHAFKVLTPDEQALITLHELEGWSISELAELQSRTEGAIKAQLFRARRKMRNALIKFSDNPESTTSTDLDEDERCVVAK